MTQQFEDFVNAALDKSLASDVTLPTANKIPVYTGIGRQVTGKTPDELGLAVLVDGVVPANQLPSYVDDVLEFANLASFPVTGESGKVYVAIDTKKTYRWSGSTYVQIGSDLALGDTVSTAYRGDRGKTAYDHSQATGNPHGATTADINDSANKRYITDAQQTVLSNTSGSNSGDETQASIKTKLGAASSGVDGYLTGSDWNTFNGKQAALADVITSNTYGNSTQWPIVTVNEKGIVTGVTLQTVPTPTLTDATFSVQKNGSPSITATWNLSALTASHVHTYPNKDINFGDLPSVATTNNNTLSVDHLRCRILGGSGNTVSGTDNIVIGGALTTLSDSRNTVIDGSFHNISGQRNFVAGGAFVTSTGSLCNIIGTSYANFTESSVLSIGDSVGYDSGEAQSLFASFGGYDRLTVFCKGLKNDDSLGVSGGRGVFAFNCINNIYSATTSNEFVAPYYSQFWNANTTELGINSTLSKKFPSYSTVYGGYYTNEASGTNSIFEGTRSVTMEGNAKVKSTATLLSDGSPILHRGIVAYKTNGVAVHDIYVSCADKNSNSGYVTHRRVVVDKTGAIQSQQTIGTDVAWGTVTWTIAIDVSSGALRISVSHSGAAGDTKATARCESQFI